MKQISLKKNFVMNVILTVTTFIFPLITFPYISRILHADGMGKVSFATSIVTYFNMFAQLGIPTYGIKICAGYREDKVKLTKTVQELMVINLITTILSYTGLLICLTFVQKLQNDKVLLLIVSSTIILNTIGMEWLYIAMRKELKEMFRAISCWKIVVAVVAASAIAVCIKIMKFNSFVSLICSGTLFFSVYILVLLTIKERFTLEMTNQIITKAKQMYNRN